MPAHVVVCRKTKHRTGRCALLVRWYWSLYPYWASYCPIWACASVARNWQRLFAPHKHPIQLRQRDLEPRRPSVVALVGALGLFHLAQDGVHLGQRELLVGAHGGVAGEGGQQFVAALGEGAAGAE